MSRVAIALITIVAVAPACKKSDGEGGEASAKGEVAAAKKPAFPAAELTAGPPKLVGELGKAKLGEAFSAQPAGVFAPQTDASKDSFSATFVSEFEGARLSGYVSKGKLVTVSVKLDGSMKAELEKVWGPSSKFGRGAEVQWLNPANGVRAVLEETNYGKPESELEFSRYTALDTLLVKGGLSFEKTPIIGAGIENLRSDYASLLVEESAEQQKKSLEGAAKMAGNADVAKLATGKPSARLELAPGPHDDAATSNMWVHLDFGDDGKVTSYRVQISYIEGDAATRDGVKAAIDAALGPCQESKDYSDVVWNCAGGFVVKDDDIGDAWDVRRRAEPPAAK